MVDLAASSTLWSANPLPLHHQHGVKRKQQEEQRHNTAVISQEDYDDESDGIMEDNQTGRMWDGRFAKRARLAPFSTPTIAVATPSFSFPSFSKNSTGTSAQTGITPFRSVLPFVSPSLPVSPQSKSKDTLMQRDNNTAAVCFGVPPQIPSGQARGADCLSPEKKIAVEWWKKTGTAPSSAAACTPDRPVISEKQTCFICLSTPSSQCTTSKLPKANKNSLLSYFTPKTSIRRTHTTCQSEMTSRTTLSLSKCTHCDRSACTNCTKTCASCQDQFCSFCSTVNYDLAHERVFCLDCCNNISQQRGEAEDTVCAMEM